MRIAYTTHQFFPDYGAGTEVLTLHTAREMRARGHEAVVFTGYPVKGRFSRENAEDAYEYGGLPVFRFRHSNTWSLLPENPMEAEYENLFFAGLFRRELRRFRPDVVHFCHLQRVSASAVAVCFELGIPMVYTVTDFWPLCPTNQLLLPDLSLCEGPDGDGANCIAHLAGIHGGAAGRFFRALPPGVLGRLARISGMISWPERSVPAMAKALAARPGVLRERMNRIDAILIATGFMGETLARFGVERKRIRRVPFGIPGCDGTSPPATDRRRRETFRAGFIGTLYEHKGAHVLLEALRRLPADLPVEVLLYGDAGWFPSYGERLRSLAGGDERVRFCGTFPGERTGEVLGGMDVLVVPSLWHENSPLVILEAQRAGVPVIASRVGGTSELIREGENGFLFERGDDGELSRILERLCRDGDLVGRLSRNAPAPRTMESYAGEIEGIYRALASGGR
ncbi:MAG TPA: glycosyltransferase [Syntrophales bacterium]|nr:glycosyltransferase [Syntrophales bacterium]